MRAYNFIAKPCLCVPRDIRVNLFATSLTPFLILILYSIIKGVVPNRLKLSFSSRHPQMLNLERTRNTYLVYCQVPAICAYTQQYSSPTSLESPLSPCHIICQSAASNIGHRKRSDVVLSYCWGSLQTTSSLPASSTSSSSQGDSGSTIFDDGVASADGDLC